MNPAQLTFLAECRALNAWAELVCLTYEDANSDAGSLYDARIEDFCEATKQEWYGTYDPVRQEWDGPYEPMHLKAMVSECRNAFDFYGLSAAFKHFFHEHETYVVQRKQASAQQIWKRQGKQYPISQAQVDALLSAATALLHSNRFVDLVNGLCLVTGRRPYEMGVVGQLRMHRKPAMTANQYCYFRRRAKTDEELSRSIVQIPVLLPPELVCAALHRVRSLYNMRCFHPRYTRPGLLSLDRQFMNQQGSQLRKACTKHFHHIVPDMKEYLKGSITPQSLRKFFRAIVAVQWNHEGMAAPRFIAESLGHAGLGHADEYMDVYVKDPAPQRFLAYFLLQEKE